MVEAATIAEISSLRPMLSTLVSSLLARLKGVTAAARAQATPGLMAVFESPEDGQAISGVTVIRGWAFAEEAEASITEVQLVIDGTPDTTIPCCSERADVAAAFPGNPNALNSGWGTTFNYGLLTSGFHTIGVQIKDSTGAPLTLDHDVTVARVGEFEFLDQFDLSGATARIEGEEIMVEGVVVRDKATQQTKEVDVQLRWLMSSQVLGIVSVSAKLKYLIEDFDDILTEQDKTFNDFAGSMGEIADGCIDANVAEGVSSSRDGASLQLTYDFTRPECGSSGTGYFLSLFGPTGFSDLSLNFTNLFSPVQEKKNIERICFSVRGSGSGGQPHEVRVELKDYRDSSDFLAKRVISIEDDTTWKEVCLDANVENSEFWEYNVSNQPPDITRMKILALVVEQAQNAPTGQFFIDNLRLVDKDDAPLNLARADDETFLDLVEKRTFQYFIDWVSKEASSEGHIFDKATAPDTISIAATGFGLSALPIGVERGWVSKEFAQQQVLDTLNSLVGCPQGLDPQNSCGYKGLFYHFLDSKTGNRKFPSELSTIDTALLMYGVLMVRSYFQDDQEIVSLADQLYQSAEWDFFLDPGTQQLYHAWKPEEADDYKIPAPGGGFFSTRSDGSPLTWDVYTDEIMLLNLLAIASPTHPVPPETFYKWARSLDPTGSFVVSFSGSLFTYFFASCWLNLEALGTDKHPEMPTNWFENSQKAIAASRECTVARQDDAGCDGDANFTTYGPESWGVTAAEGPDDIYRGYGEACVAVDQGAPNDGTIATYGAGSSIVFLPTESIATLRHYFADTDLWRYRFGFGDAYNTDVPQDSGCFAQWHNHNYWGINQGPLLLNIENYRTGLIWNLMASNPDLRRAVALIFSGSL